MPPTTKFWMAATVVSICAFGFSACGGSTKSSGSGGLSAHTNSVFCADDIKLDKALGNIQNESDLLTEFKANQSVINEMATHLPSGSVGNEAKQVLGAVQQAISKSDVTAVQNVPTSYGADIDTYCGVDTNGDPLPSDFAKGKGTSICNTDATLSDGVSNAANSSDALAFLKANQNDINAFAAGISSLPTFEQANAQAVVSNVRTAISSNNPSGLEAQAFQDAATSVDLYCGINH
jgi:hypothetical protein